MKIKYAWLFYVLSFTWGIILSLVGCLVTLGLLITGHKPKKWGYCWYFNVGKSWGGLELGPCFIVDSSDTLHLKCHEFGHGIQNCFYGPFMLILVSIPSVIRYWYRELRYNRKGVKPPTDYDDIWFEGQATKVGKENYYATYIRNLQRK